MTKYEIQMYITIQLLDSATKIYKNVFGGLFERIGLILKDSVYYIIRDNKYTLQRIFMILMILKICQTSPTHKHVHIYTISLQLTELQQCVWILTAFF